MLENILVLAMFWATIRYESGFNWSVGPDLDLRRQNEIRNEKSVMTDENYGCKGQGRNMDARNRGKLWLQGTDENYGCKKQRKTWLQGTDENYGCKDQEKTMDARNRGKLRLQGTEETMAARERGKL